MKEEYRGFKAEKLDEKTILELKKLAKLTRGDILKMTTLANSGHPGGSLSSIDFYLTLHSFANVSHDAPNSPNRDRIVVSHGHTSPGVYATLGRFDFFDIREAITSFRKAGSLFEGHVERRVPGVEWSTGNLGQGLSAGCGFALAAKILKKDFQVFVAMSDGEQQKGQVSEGRRFAKKYNLNNLTVIMDYNGLQMSGPLQEIMPQNVKENYRASGWKVLEIDGHNYQEIYQALHQAVATKDSPVAIIAHTIMGKGVPSIENQYQYHGKPLTQEQYEIAFKELGLQDDLEKYRKLRGSWKLPQTKAFSLNPLLKIDLGSPRTYSLEEKLENRKAFGQTLKELAELNCGREGQTPLAVFDCDVIESVRTDGFREACPDHYFQGGIQEHNTAAMAGALSTQGVVSFFVDFGVFGIDESYNQHRLNDINETNLKLIVTHCGLDVGEDGKTHHCLDYLGALDNLFGYKVIVPADPNQTDRAVRFVAANEGNYAVALGRSKLPVIATKEGQPFFAGDYQFHYGKIDLVREGDQAAIITMGSMLHRVVQAWERLNEMGHQVMVLNVSCPKDLEEKKLEEATKTGLITTYEDHNVRTGLGAIIANFLAEKGIKVRLRKIGVDHYASSGAFEELFKSHGLDTDSLVKVVLEEIKGGYGEKQSL